MRARRAIRARTRGMVLLEALIAVLLVAVCLLVLLQVRNSAMQQYLQLGDQYTGSWLAELKMAELVSENLPDPADEDTWYLSGGGDFSDFNARLNDLNYGRNENWAERGTFSKYEFEWKKELIFVGKDFIGTREEMDAWVQPVDDSNEPIIDLKDPHTQPAARLVRVTLKVHLPMPRGRDAQGEEESDYEHEKRRTITLVTYVDPNTMHKAEIESVEPAATTPAPTTTNTSTGGR